MWEEFMTPGKPDDRIKVYKVNEKGVKELVRVDKFNPFEHEMEDDEMAKPQLDINWEPVIKRGYELVDEGQSLSQAAKTIRDEMNLDCSITSIYNRIKFEKQQAPTKEKIDPAQATNQEPEQSQEPAEDSMSSEQDEVKGTDVPATKIEIGCPFDDPNTFNPENPATIVVELNEETIMRENLRKKEEAREKYTTPQFSREKISPKEWIKARHFRSDALVNAVVADPIALQMVREMIERGIV